MLKTLNIKNYALIEELTVEFSSGLVIITGETGSGKSIIIDALGLILGARSSPDVVRKGSGPLGRRGDVPHRREREAATDTRRKRHPRGDELIVRREVSSKGQSRCFIADSPATLALQKRVGELLVDLHGQHEHQSLLRIETHIAMLDDFGGLDGIVAEFHEARKKLMEIGEELDSLRQREQQLAEKREFYEFQIAEIDAVAPGRGGRGARKGVEDPGKR